MNAEMDIKSYEVPGLTIADQTGAFHATPIPGMTMNYSQPDQSGFNTFEPEVCLRRHVHKSKDGKRLVAEDITILNHPILLEVSGAKYLVEPGTHVRIGAGVPHSWGTLKNGFRA